MNILTFVVAVRMLACLIGFFNARLFRLTPSVRMLTVGLLASAGTDRLVGEVVKDFDFFDWFLQGALPFLLFAGALELELALLFEQKRPLLALPLITTVVSTTLIGFWRL